VQAEAIASL